MNLMGKSSPGVQPARANVKGRKPQSCLCVDFIALLKLKKGYIYMHIRQIHNIALNDNLFCITFVNSLRGDKHEFNIKAVVSYEPFQTMLPKS